MGVKDIEKIKYRWHKRELLRDDEIDFLLSAVDRLTAQLEDARALANKLDEILVNTQDGDFTYLMEQNKKLEAENARLQTENNLLASHIADINDAHKKVMDEKCPTDEVHCSCVPILRAELEKWKKLVSDAGIQIAALQEVDP